MLKFDETETIAAMERYGGGFAGSIGKAAAHADALNYARLREAFPDLWEEYAAMAQQLEMGRRDKQ